MKFLIWILLNTSIIGFAQQNMIVIGNKSYKATNEITFKCKSYSWSDLTFNIAKNENTGFAIFSIGVAMNFDLFGNEVGIVLDNGSIIKCKTPITRNYLDERSSAAFKLSATDMAQLRESNIQKIVFSIINKPKTESTTAGNYTADNKLNIETKTFVSNLEN